MIRDDEFEAALQRAPEVRVPRNFAQRVVARMPEAAVGRRNGWRLPVLGFAGGVGLVVVVLLLSSVAGLRLTVAALGVECAAAVWWFWRVVRS